MTRATSTCPASPTRLTSRSPVAPSNARTPAATTSFSSRSRPPASMTTTSTGIAITASATTRPPSDTAGVPTAATGPDRPRPTPPMSSASRTTLSAKTVSGYQPITVRWLRRLFNPSKSGAIESGPDLVDEPDPDLEREYERMLAEFAAVGAPLDGHPGARILANPGPYEAPLVDWLERSEHPSIKHWLLQLLGAVPDPPGFAEALLREYGRFELPDDWRWSVGNALYDLNDRAL